MRCHVKSAQHSARYEKELMLASGSWLCTCSYIRLRKAGLNSGPVLKGVILYIYIYILSQFKLTVPSYPC